MVEDTRSLSPKFKKMHEFAEKYYPSLKKVEASDNAQEFFTSAGTHYRKGVELTTLMALRAANEQQGITQ